MLWSLCDVGTYTHTYVRMCVCVHCMWLLVCEVDNRGCCTTLVLHLNVRTCICVTRTHTCTHARTLTLLAMADTSKTLSDSSKAAGDGLTLTNMVTRPSLAPHPLPTK